jgi:hypothetical protein
MIRTFEQVHGCGQQTCPDCALASLIAEFARLTGCNIESAKLTHWPGQKDEVVDEFIVKEGTAYDVLQRCGTLAVFPRVPRVRHGSF